MKLFPNCVLIVSLAVVFLEAGAQHDVDFGTITLECQADHNISESELADLQKDVTDMTDMADVDMKFKCFTQCVMKKMGYLDANDKLDADKFLSNDRVQSEKVKECKALHDLTEDPCEYIFDIYFCVLA